MLNRVKSLFSLLLSFVFIMTSQAWSEEMCSSYTSDFAILKTNLYPINLEDPIGDLQIRVIHGDYRFLSLNEFGVIYPGLNFPDDKTLLCLAGERNIEGTSDALDGDEHADLVIEFGTYVTKYNTLMKKHLEKVKVKKEGGGHP
ncbi:MAG: hypothetical protein DRR42_17340 [Gammaproteobacteria bacterium]|nr:MAG: hypothetical protein DRR42_17340 [Gammaproteobacteria bacterium]